MVDENDDAPAPPSAPASPQAGLPAAFKQAFAQYLADHQIQPAPDGELKVDVDFLKEHAGPLIVQMLRGATQSLMPRELKLSLNTPGEQFAALARSAPAAVSPDGSDAAPGETKAAPPLHVSFDLGDFLARLLNPPRG